MALSAPQIPLLVFVNADAPSLSTAGETLMRPSQEPPAQSAKLHAMTGHVELIRSALLSDRAEYAYAATAPKDARMIFLAGACPLNPDGSTAALGDYAGQAAACIETMTGALEAAGVTITDVISTRVLVASSRQEDLLAAWNVVRGAFGQHDVPSTLLGVTVLGYRDQLVEIEAVAVAMD